MMKHLYLILLSVLPFAAFSQSTLYFSYDAAGNQVLRDVVCINCGGITVRANDKLASDEKLMLSAKSLTAFPNPVTQKLRLQWVSDETNPLQHLQLQSANGSLLLKLPIKVGAGQTELDFSLYPSGLYLLTGVGTGGKITTIKVIKQ